MSYLIGIDGGGTHLRVVITSSDLQICGESHAGTANPSVIGRESAAQLIQSTIIDALNSTQITPNDVYAVGIGIAGAADSHSEVWLREIMQDVLPDTLIVPSSDVEIALVGAHGRREGIILLAGTGSIGYGVNEKGEALQVGGWGYMLGDEGSGYWIGMQALRVVINQFDVYGTQTEFTHSVLNGLNLSHSRELVRWIYRSDRPRISEIAQLAEMVLEFAEQGEIHAKNIVESAAQALANLCHILINRLDLSADKTAFAGGLLTSQNLLSQRLCDLLSLSQLPVPRYSPVIGAALLAKVRFEETTG